ncbi:MAG TPA: response regulator transcription factor [Polyangiaceae bacterium]
MNGAPMAHVLLVDDDRALTEALSLVLESEGHRVSVAGDGNEALAKIAADAPDLVVSDVNMPNLDGLALCKRLRERGNHVPVVLLTSRDGEIDEALGLELGADDYVTKPFVTRILLARIGALLRRQAHRRSDSKPSAPVTAGKLVLDAERLEGRYDGTLLALTLTEFRILEALASRPGIVLSRSRLLEIVRGDDSVVADRIVDTYVRRLRRKIESIEPAFSALETVVGAGYRWR